MLALLKLGLSSSRLPFELKAWEPSPAPVAQIAERIKFPVAENFYQNFPVLISAGVSKDGISMTALISPGSNRSAQQAQPSAEGPRSNTAVAATLMGSPRAKPFSRSGSSQAGTSIFQKLPVKTAQSEGRGTHLETAALRADNPIVQEEHLQTANAETIIAAKEVNEKRPNSAEALVISVRKNPLIPETSKKEISEKGHVFFEKERLYSDAVGTKLPIIQKCKNEIRLKTRSKQAIESQAQNANRALTIKEKKRVDAYNDQIEKAQSELNTQVNELNKLAMEGRKKRTELTKQVKTLLQGHRVSELESKDLARDFENLRLDANHVVDQNIVEWLLHVNGEPNPGSLFSDDVLSIAQVKYAFYRETKKIDTTVQNLFENLGPSDQKILRNVFNELHNFEHSQCFGTLLNIKEKIEEKGAKNRGGKGAEAVRKEIFRTYLPLVQNWNGSLINNEGKKIDFLEMSFYILSATNEAREQLGINLKDSPTYRFGSKIKESSVTTFYESLKDETGGEVSAAKIQEQCSRVNPTQFCPTLAVHHFYHKAFGGKPNIGNAWVFMEGFHGLAHLLDDVYRMGVLKTTGLGQNAIVFLGQIDSFTQMQNPQCPKVQKLQK